MRTHAAERDFIDHTSPVTLDNCAREPIHIPSAIQPHGALLAARVSDLRIAYVSENAGRFLGYASTATLGLTLTEILGAESATAIQKSLERDSRSSPARLTIPSPISTEQLLHIHAHRIQDLICIEFEPLQQGLQWDLLAERMEAVVEGLQRTNTRTELCAAAVTEIRCMTGYDSVMIYQFHEDDHGEVIAEDKVSDMPSRLHQHFPASDIPAQARALYLIQRIRMVADVEYIPVPVIGHGEMTHGEPLEMTHCSLRSVSPIHIQYMKNMGVGASFAISLVHSNVLWGLIICHHRTAHLMRPEVRALCDLLGRIISMLTGATETNGAYEQQLARRRQVDQLIALLLPVGPLAEVLVAHPEQFLGAVAASGALIQIQGQVRLIGETPVLVDALSILSRLRERLVDGLVSFSALQDQIPEFSRFASCASGALLLEIGDTGNDWALFLRPEVSQVISWGGDPGCTKAVNLTTGDISPRESFAAWRETQHGKAYRWSDLDLLMARELQRLLTATGRRHADARQARLSYVDALTGLPNRRVLLDRLAQRCNESPQRASSLIFLDIDRFKTVNDTLGHSAGDELLIQVGHRLLERVGPSHLVARLGGDEFVVFCEDTNLTDGQLVAHSIVQGFHRPFLLDGKPFRCTASVGLAPADAIGIQSTTDILHGADSAMYIAKQQGGNQFAMFASLLPDKVLRQSRLEQDLFQAIVREEMFLHFQAQVSVNGLHLIGFEALLRWKHPLYGEVPPSEFIPMAEHSGHIRDIGAWVLQEALQTIGDWRQLYRPELFVAVNVSARQLESREFCSTVSQAIRDARVAASALHLEVTESALIHPLAEPQLNALQSLGIKIAIDDFGTGYSSLSYLQRLAISEVKLDRTFIEDVGNDQRKAVLLAAIVQMAHSLQLEVVAEGIENVGQLDCVRKCLCDSAQGYLFSRPISRLAVEDRFQAEWSNGYAEKISA